MNNKQQIAAIWSHVVSHLAIPAIKGSQRFYELAHSTVYGWQINLNYGDTIEKNVSATYKSTPEFLAYLEGMRDLIKIMEEEAARNLHTYRAYYDLCEYNVKSAMDSGDKPSYIKDNIEEYLVSLSEKKAMLIALDGEMLRQPNDSDADTLGELAIFAVQEKATAQLSAFIDKRWREQMEKRDSETTWDTDEVVRWFLNDAGLYSALMRPNSPSPKEIYEQYKKDGLLEGLDIDPSNVDWDYVTDVVEEE